MKKKILSSFLAVIMTVCLFVAPVYAVTGDIVIDMSNPTANPSNLAIANGVVTFPTTNGVYVEYEVTAAEAGSYYINFERANIGSGNFYIAVTVNGEIANRRTGRIQNSDGSFTFQNEVWLSEGTNTIKIANMSNNDGTLKNVSFTKLDKVQVTASMNQDGGRTFKSAYKTGLAVDPWLWINDTIATYPDGTTAPYITFEMTVPKEGYYSPAVAIAGADKVRFKIDDDTFDINDNCVTLSESYKASGNSTCTWYMSNDNVYLEAGTYDVTLQLYSPGNATKWNTFIGAARLIEYIPELIEKYDGDIVLDMAAPDRNSGAEVDGDTLIMSEGDWIEYDIHVTEDASYYVNFKRENAGDANYYLQVSANGKTVNRRTGRIQNGDGSYTFQNELQLKEGKNTIKIATMNSATGIVSDVSLTKLDKIQYTTTMNSSEGGRTFKDAYKSGLGVDPWLYILEPISTYPPSNSPFVTFDVEIGKAGYYYPELARAGVTYAKMYVDSQSFDLHGNAEELSEKFMSSGSSSCTWKRSKDAVYLTEGTHEVRVQTVGARYTDSMEWRLSVGAVRFTQAPDQHTKVVAEAEDARLYVGASNDPIEFDEGEIKLMQLDDDAAAKTMSAATVTMVDDAVENAPITMEFDVVITKEGDYKVEVLKAHDTEKLSEGKLSITLENGDVALEELTLDDANVTVVENDYIKHTSWGNHGLDVLSLDDTVHLPVGMHTIKVTCDETDTNEDGTKVLMVFDAVRFEETVDVSDVTAMLYEPTVGVGKRINVAFENADGQPVYLNKLGNVTFSSSDQSIVTVDGEGVIRGVRPGNAMIFVNIGRVRERLPISVTADNGLVIYSAELDDNGNVEITFSANENEKFDIIVANYELQNGMKSSLRGAFDKETVRANGEEQTITIEKPLNATGFGELYEIYMWENESGMIPVYQKITLQ